MKRHRKCLFNHKNHSHCSWRTIEWRILDVETAVSPQETCLKGIFLSVREDKRVDVAFVVGC